PTGAGTRVHEDRTRYVLLQFLIDVPHHLFAFFDVGLNRLLVEQRFELLVAVVRIVALRAAGIVLIESLVWIVDAVASKVEPDGIIVARNLGEPLARFDRIEFPIDIDRLELVNQHDRRIAIGGEIAGGYSDLK